MGNAQAQDLFYAAGQASVGKIFALERQDDNSLVLVDTIDMGKVHYRVPHCTAKMFTQAMGLIISALRQMEPFMQQVGP